MVCLDQRRPVEVERVLAQGLEQQAVRVAELLAAQLVESLWQPSLYLG
jgi:hypothetical protein